MRVTWWRAVVSTATWADEVPPAIMMFMWMDASDSVALRKALAPAVDEENLDLFRSQVREQLRCRVLARRQRAASTCQPHT